MPEAERVRCPRCGDADNTLNLRARFAEIEVLRTEAREAGARRGAEQAAKPPVTRSGSGSGSVGDVDDGNLDPLGGLDLMGEELILGLLGRGLVWAAGKAARKAVWDPLKKRAGPAFARARAEQERRSATLSATLDQHPELWACPRDNVVFCAGGGKTVPARDAMTWLLKGDDARLMAALGQA